MTADVAIRWIWLAVALSSSLGAGCSAPGARVHDLREGIERTFDGRVDDLDFIEGLGWCQVILRKTDDQLVAVTRDHRVQTLLELGFQTGNIVEVTYREGHPNELIRVKVNRDSR